MEGKTGKWIRTLKGITFSPHLNYICPRKVKSNRRAAQLARIQNPPLATPARISATNIKLKAEKLRTHSYSVLPSFGLVDKPR